MEEFIALLGMVIGYSAEEINNIHPEQELTMDLGISSLEMMTLLFEIEHRYNIDLPTNKLAAVRTVGDLYSLINNQ